MNKNSPHRSVLLTGATGFLGTQIARRLLHEKDLTIIALVRAENQEAAALRLSRAWWDWPELASALRAKLKIEVLQGDVSLPQLGINDAAYASLVERITHIIHTAADLRVNAPIDELRKTNLLGTSNMLTLAHDAHYDHKLERYAHVSTAYVAGRRSGEIEETDLSKEYGFSNAYELSKYEGECLVQAAKRDLPISVFRPGMVVGSSDTGEIRTFNTFYFPLRLYLTGKLHVIPMDPAMPVNIIPVDYVADAIARLTFCLEAEGLNFHLTAPAETLPQAGELVEFVRVWARERFEIRLPRPLFIKLPLPQKIFQPDQRLSGHSVNHAQARMKPIQSELKNLQTLLPYFNERKQFQRGNVDRLLGPYPMDWSEFMPHLLKYAIDQNFLHRTDRTVHEQLLARLGSKTRPVNYFDIVQGKFIPRSTDEVRLEILAAAGALTALGVQPGERVAIVGLNSTRYLALDAAIGLMGAISVPLYYTSPPTEIDHILSASGARLLLIGAPKILERLNEIHTDLPVISFCREPISSKLERRIIHWEDFLKMGSGRPATLHAPVGFDDLATLRYTSGTTGQPKGVSFQHQQLRWMGQTMATLLPWKTRNKTANYLSFLPMNHVVEGILATYCPYYLPAAVNIYFLEDLKEIQSVLPRIRPTVFFSVPRIYEKIWEALEENPVGRRYLSLPEGFVKRALGAVLHWQTLRKAGLDRCDQLITGSAPCGEGLLQNYRELGIEIHNAYGLTEAPLITLNRKGENRLSTVGEPLPKTEICVADDGEVLVRGPQVMTGYFDEKDGEEITQPFRDGWLLTGDLGYLSPDGSLILKGRKKELFKTSYGKYIQPGKVESLLREIPGVAEAMLVGEERPYCVALLWIQDKVLNAATQQRIDRMIGQINLTLAHPEQVKRWAVMANDLSIEASDLTANLKLKRQAIYCRLKDVVEALYKGINQSYKVLFFGEAGKG
jgi:long-chain acyl-CoA synthetase